MQGWLSCENRDICLPLFLSLLNSLRYENNGRHCADDMLKYIYLNENYRILFQNLPKFVAAIQIDDHRSI